MLQEDSGDLPRAEEPSDDEIMINYPSGKLGAMTRKRNDISKLLESNVGHDLSLIKTLSEQLILKKNIFFLACKI